MSARGWPRCWVSSGKARLHPCAPVAKRIENESGLRTLLDNRPRLAESDTPRNALRLSRFVRSCARETNRDRGGAAAGYAAGRGAETAALRRLAVRSGAAYGTASSRTRAPIPQRQQPRTSEPERSYPRPAHGGGLERLALRAPPPERAGRGSAGDAPSPPHPVRQARVALRPHRRSVPLRRRVVRRPGSGSASAAEPGHGD